MNHTYKKNILLFFILIIGLGMQVVVSAQQILNITEIPHDIVHNTEPLDIHIIDEKIIVPIFTADNRIYQYLPNLEVDSFHTPENLLGNFPTHVRSTMYAEYEPGIGFVDKDLVNYRYEPYLTKQGDYVGFAGNTRASGINGNEVFPYPVSVDSFPPRMSTIVIQNRVKDSIIYKNVFAEGRKFELRSVLEGDFIYVNIPLTWEDQVTWGDLVFMGDTLTYDIATFWTRGSNYLSKINFKTGEKEWTRHIGYGDVHQIVVDDQHRINMEIETSAPAMYNNEWEDPDHDLETNGTYDRLIYRMSADGVLEDYTYIKTHSVPAIYEVEFNRDGSFQAFGLVEAPIYVDVEGDSLDFTDAMSFEESKGLILVYDNSLDFKWGKKIVSDGRTLIQAVNKNPNGDYVVSCACESETITIDGVKYQGPPPPSSLQDLLDQAILARFDSEGNLLGIPVFGSHNAYVEDLQALGENHFLINYRKIGNYGLEFLDEIFNPTRTSYLIEYEGDIFDIMTSVEEYFAAEAIRISPNSAVRGGQVEVTLPKEDWNGGSATIQLYTIMGRAVDIPTTLYGSANIAYTIPNNIAPGMYYMRIDYKNKRTTMPIYIQ